MVAPDFQKFYDAEFERWDRLRGAVTTPLALLTLLGGVLGTMRQSLVTSDHSLPWGLFLAAFGLALLSFVVAVYFLVRSYHGYSYRALPKPLELKKYRDGLLKHFERQDDGGAKVEAKFAAYLEGALARTADYNTVVNQTKSNYLYRATTAIILCGVLTALAFAPHAVLQARQPAPVYTVELTEHVRGETSSVSSGRQRGRDSGAGAPAGQGHQGGRQPQGPGQTRTEQSRAGATGTEQTGAGLAGQVAPQQPAVQSSATPAAFKLILDWAGALAPVALVLLSAALGFAAGRVGTWRDRRKRRLEVATALLIELRWLERILRKLARHKQAASSTVRPLTDVQDRFQADLVLFKPQTLRTLLELRGLIRDIEVSRDTLQGSLDTLDDKAHHFFRVKASFAAQLIPKLKGMLEREGATVPSDSPVVVLRYPQLPELPPPAFAEAMEDTLPPDPTSAA
jgi:hypothetical protein